MRKNTTIIKCDGGGCKTYVEVESSTDARTGNGGSYLPSHWIKVMPSDELGHVNGQTGSFEFCSLKCVSRWATMRRNERGEQEAAGTTETGGTYRKYPCPSCDAQIAPQGFRQHWVTAHADQGSFEEAKELYDAGKEG